MTGEPPAEFLPQAALAQLPRLDALARRRFRESSIAEEAMGYLLEQLEANEWERVRRFEGRSSFVTFLITVATRLLEDFSRRRFGRLRVPDWVRDRGALWVRLYELLCMERWSAGEAREIAIDTAPGGREASMVDAIIRAIRQRYPDCGAPAPGEVPADDLDALGASTGQAALTQADAPEALLLERERSALLQALDGLLPETADDAQPGRAPPSGLAEALKARLGMGTEERLLLKLVFQDGLQVTAAGAQLGLTPHQAHGRLRRLLGRIRKALRDLGFDLEPEDFR